MRRFLIVAALIAVLCSPAHAAIGDAVTPPCSSVAAAAVLDIQPGAGVEWLIHNIWFEDNITIQRYDGTNTVNTAALLGPDFQPLLTRVTSTNRIRIRNDHISDPKLICFDGVVTAE